jgi:hypothetical protein
MPSRARLFFEKGTAAASALLGQIPWLVTVVGGPSLYQPSIYKGKEFFLIAPMMVAVVAAWATLRYRWAMWAIFIAFGILVVVVYWIYTTASVGDQLHSINWILSYCVFALFVVALGKLLVDLTE